MFRHHQRILSCISLTSETYTGESSNLILLLRFRISISAKPVAAHKKPVVVCRIESQLG